MSGYLPSNYPVPAFDDSSGTVPAVTERPLLTTRQVATLLGLSPATVLRRWRAGELPGYRLASNCLRFDANEIAAWLEARRRGASSF
jgi:excisionase family DNA binding protein